MQTHLVLCLLLLQDGVDEGWDHWHLHVILRAATATMSCHGDDSSIWQNHLGWRWWWEGVQAKWDGWPCA